MNLNSFLLLALCTALLAVLFFIMKLRRVREQLAIIEEALEDIQSGNPNRRVLARKNDMTKRICYAINEIAVQNQSQLIQQKQSEQAYKRLMTSLSHDVKTPLASLFGYLEAVENGLVIGEEKEAYIHRQPSKPRVPVSPPSTPSHASPHPPCRSVSRLRSRHTHGLPRTGT